MVAPRIARRRMTYNFDPDRWYDNQRALIDARRAAGTLDEDEFARALEDLERRYEEMLERVGRSFRLPEGNVGNQESGGRIRTDPCAGVTGREDPTPES
jgi:hypothetical protein